MKKFSILCGVSAVIIMTSTSSFARPSMCTAQGKCVDVISCEMDGSSACGTDLYGASACYYGGSCYGTIAAPNFQIFQNNAIEVERSVVEDFQLNNQPLQRE